MSKHSRPTKQFGFIGENFEKLSNTQRSLIRRTNYKGVYFNNGVGAQSKEETLAMLRGDEASDIRGIVTEIKEIVIDWESADGLELDGPTYLTLEMKGQDLLRFKVGDDFEFEFYSNVRNFIDVSGSIRRIS
jgi:hypothetical protein